jgi:pyocin large subunit-like protein
VLLLLALWMGACAPAPPPIETAHAAPGWHYPRSVGFKSREHLEEHFAKHGREVGAASTSEYLAKAQALRDAPLSADVLEMARADGVITRFDKKDGAFVAFEIDGSIRTYFKPNTGETYFRHQAERE